MGTMSALRRREVFVGRRRLLYSANVGVWNIQRIENEAVTGGRELNVGYNRDRCLPVDHLERDHDIELCSVKVECTRTTT